MDENLITKKELLERTGISYGALYRWKRMKLLPDEWFVHRSTFTGHETFFPRERVLERVAEIQRLKEEMSLEEIARHFSPAPSGALSLTPAEAVEYGIAPPPIVNQYLALRPGDRLDEKGLLALYIFSELLQAGLLSRDEAMETADAAVSSGDIAEPVIYLVRKYGVAFCVTASEMQKIRFDEQSTLALELSVSGKKTALSALLREKGVSL